MDASQTKIFIAILVTCLIIGTILLYFIVSLVQQQRRNNKMYHLKIAAEITTLENERMRMSGDLHDELGPLLSAIKFKLGSIDIADPEDAVQMTESCSYLNDIITRMREISNNLMPATLLNKGLAAAVKEFIDKIPRSAGVTIQFNSVSLPEMSKENNINIYRIIQEITHNTLKHAAATALDINIDLSGSTLILLSRDNGKGFDYSAAYKENNGLGLRNLLSRTDMMQGKLYLDSQLGKGTSYTVEIPV